ncbi:MAG: helix-turn-helix transcriptional regulator [Nakamurella sp.]
MGDVIAFPAHRSGRRSVDASSSTVVSTTASRVRVNPATPAAHREPLWREVTGAVLRSERQRQQRTLAQVAERAGMSVQYLSELERGRKEASSEMLAAACGSLGLSIGEFARRCARSVDSVTARPGGPVLLAA